MKRWIAVTAVLLAGWFVGSHVATGATSRTLSYGAAAFVQVPASTHEGPPTCDPGPTDQAATELKGAMLQPAGAYLLAINPPHGATVTQLRYVVVDSGSDPGDDSHVFLVRKRLNTGVDKGDGYVLMARADSSGSSQLTRQFVDNTIEKPVIDTSQFFYMLELVSCILTMEPIGVQVRLQIP